MLKLTSSFLKNKIYVILEDFTISPSTENVEKRFLVLPLLSTKLRNTLSPNSLGKLMQLILLEPHIDDLDWGEITDLDKSPNTLLFISNTFISNARLKLAKN